MAKSNLASRSARSAASPAARRAVAPASSGAAGEPAAKGLGKAEPLSLEAVRAVVDPVVTRHGLVLLDVEWTVDPVGRVLRITMERAGATVDHAGVTLDDCANVSRDTSAALDADDVIPCAYHLEVSSPGIERRLRHLEDFARFSGKLAKLKLSQPAPDGQRVLRGRLEAAPAGRVAVRVDGKRLEVPIESVADAHLVFDPDERASSPEALGAGHVPRLSD